MKLMLSHLVTSVNFPPPESLRTTLPIEKAGQSHPSLVFYHGGLEPDFSRDVERGGWFANDIREPASHKKVNSEYFTFF